MSSRQHCGGNAPHGSLAGAGAVASGRPVNNRLANRQQGQHGSPDMTDRLAFSGLTVLDFSQGVAGPHATMLLALHGADVIKIEPLEGDWGRALGKLEGDHCAHSVAFNRGKRSIALDLKSADGVAVVKKIAAKADVVVESFRPGVIARLGFGYGDLKKI